MKRMYVRFAQVVLVAGLAASALQAQGRFVAVISHRGEHLRHPENTLAAFAEAARVGADYFELDVRTTMDGKLVLMHDAMVDRTTNGKGAVAKLTFAEVRALEPAVPTFDEALEFARGRIGVYVDAKAISAAEVVAHLATQRMTDNVVIYSGKILPEIQKLEPRLKVMPEARSVEVAQRMVAELHPKVMAFDAGDFRPEVIVVAKQAGAMVFVDRLGPADNQKAWQEAIDLGADGIQTDHPEELMKYLREHGYRANPAAIGVLRR